MQQLSLHVVGADHPNADGGNRRFEILLCAPGEPIDLVPEPKNPVDPNAIAVFSVRRIQIGYLTADRAPWIGGMLRNGREIRAVFQEATRPGAAIRIGFDGGRPSCRGAIGSTPSDKRQRMSISGPTNCRPTSDHVEKKVRQHCSA